MSEWISESERASDQMRKLWADPELARRRSEAIRLGIARKKLEAMRVRAEAKRRQDT